MTDMKNLLDTLTTAHQIAEDYEQYKELIAQVLEIESTDGETVDKFALNSPYGRIEVTDDDITFTINDRSISITDIIDWMKVLDVLIHYPYDDDGNIIPYIDRDRIVGLTETDESVNDLIIDVIEITAPMPNTEVTAAINNEILTLLDLNFLKLSLNKTGDLVGRIVTPGTLAFTCSIPIIAAEKIVIMGYKKRV